jgi:WD40 repeat protein
VRVVAFSPDGALFASGDREGTVLLRRVADGEVVARLESEDLGVSALVFDHTGQHLVSGHSSGHVRRWDVASGELVRQELPENAEIRALAFGPTTPGSSGSNRLYAAVGDKVIELHGEGLVLLRQFTGHEEVVSSLAVDPEGGRLLTGSSDYTVRLWDLGTTEEIASFLGHLNGVNAVAFLPGGRRFVSASEDRTARLWSTETEAVLTLEGHRDWVMSLAFRADGEQLVSGSRDETLRVWDVRDGRLVETVTTPGATDCVAWTPDGRVAFGVWDPAVRLCRPGEDAPWEVLRGTDLFPASIAVDTTSGRILARFAEHSLLVWEPGDPEPVLALTDLDESSASAFAPDGAVFATGSLDGSVILRDTQSGRPLQRLPGNEGPITAVTFDATGELVAAGTRDRTVLLWDARSGRRLGAFRGHENQLTSIAFSPDGERLVSGSVDKTVRLWNPETGETLLALRGHASGVTAVAFSPDGSQIASASKDGTVRLWRTRTP